MRVLVRIIEADGAGIIARALDVSPEVSLPAHREQPFAELVVHASQDATVLPSRIEDLGIVNRTVPVVGSAHVGLNENAASRQPLGNFHGATPIGNAFSPRRRAANAQRRSWLRTSGAHRDHAADGLGTVRHGSGSTRDVNSLEARRIGKRGTWPNPALGAHARAVDQDERPAARETADRWYRRVTLRHHVDAGNGFERLREVLRRPAGDLCRRQHRLARGWRGHDARRGANDGDGLVRQGVDRDS